MVNNNVPKGVYTGDISEYTKKNVYLYQNIADIDGSICDTGWWCNLESSYTSGVASTIGLVGNINDYAIPGYTFKDYLIAKLKLELGIDEVCIYNNYSINDIPIDSYGCYDGRSSHKIFDRVVKALKFNDKKRALIVEDLKSYFKRDAPWEVSIAYSSILKQLMLDFDFRSSNNILIILMKTEEGIDPSLLQADIPIKLIDVNKPSELERIQMIHYLASLNRNLSINIDLRKFARITTGLSRVDLQSIWNLSLFKESLTEKTIIEYKNQIIKKEFGTYLNIYDNLSSSFSLDNFGGMNNIKSFVRKDIIQAINKGDLKTMSKGLLFMGPPGTGKTFFAKTLAKESGITFVELCLTNITSMWVGESQENLRKCLNLIKSITPCIVFIDELDQVLNRSNGDSNSVRGDLFSMMLSTMSDDEYRGKIIWVGATNYPEKIDQALIRTGRFDNKFIFMPPSNVAERKEVFKAQLNMQKYPHNIDYNSCEFEQFIEGLQDYTQAEIQGIVMKGISLSKRDGKTSLEINDLIKASKFIRKIDNKEINNMIEQAIRACNDLEFIPQELLDRYNLSY